MNERRLYRKYLLLALAALLTACTKEITYKGDAFDPLLVVSSNICADSTICCYLTATTSTLGDYPLDSLYQRSKNYVSDASLRLRINGGEWLPTTYHNNGYIAEGIQAKAGDKIDLQVEHNGYGKATVTEQVPEKPIVSAIHTTDKYPIANDSGWAQFALDIAPYQPMDSAYIGIRLVGGSCICVKQQVKYYAERAIDEEGHPYYIDYYDTIPVRDTVALNYLYTSGKQWNMYLNNHAPETSYYGAARGEWLYLSTAEAHKGLSIEMFAEHSWDYERIIGIDSIEVQNLQLEIRTLSLDYIRYLTTFERNNGRSGYIRLPSFAEYDDQYDGEEEDYDIIEELLELLAELSILGNQEGIPIYSNVDGALGCMRAYTTQEVKVY